MVKLCTFALVANFADDLRHQKKGSKHSERDLDFTQIMLEGYSTGIATIERPREFEARKDLYMGAGGVDWKFLAEIPIKSTFVRRIPGFQFEAIAAKATSIC